MLRHAHAVERVPENVRVLDVLVHMRDVYFCRADKMTYISRQY